VDHYSFYKGAGVVSYQLDMSYHRSSICGNMLRKLFSSFNFNVLFPTFILFKDISSKPGVNFRSYNL